MYVDQNNELSTRPTVKQILVFDSKYVILDIVKINERVFYHVQDTEDDKYYVLFEYTFEGSKNLKTLEASEKVHVCWFNSGYAVFTEIIFIVYVLIRTTTLLYFKVPEQYMHLLQKLYLEQKLWKTSLLTCLHRHTLQDTCLNTEKIQYIQIL